MNSFGVAGKLRNVQQYRNDISGYYANNIIITILTFARYFQNNIFTSLEFTNQFDIIQEITQLVRIIPVGFTVFDHLLPH
jgi:hypothetical protein